MNCYGESGSPSSCSLPPSLFALLLCDAFCHVMKGQPLILDVPSSRTVSQHISVHCHLPILCYPEITAQDGLRYTEGPRPKARSKARRKDGKWREGVRASAWTGVYSWRGGGEGKPARYTVVPYSLKLCPPFLTWSLCPLVVFCLDPITS
jgi:hypothetical protein